MKENVIPPENTLRIIKAVIDLGGKKRKKNKMRKNRGFKGFPE